MYCFEHVIDLRSGEQEMDRVIILDLVMRHSTNVLSDICERGILPSDYFVDLGPVRLIVL